MITCNKCGYDKAVQGLNEIWCDKCDGKETVKKLQTQTEYKVDDWYNLCSDFGLERLGGTFTRSSHSTHLANEPVTYYSNALPAQPFDEAMGDCGIQTVMFDDNQHAERLDPWDQADAYFDKQDICRFVNKFFDKEMSGCWLNLAYGGGGSKDMWRAIIGEVGGSSIVSYAHKEIHKLCVVLEIALDERYDIPNKNVMDIVRTAIEDYFEEK